MLSSGAGDKLAAVLGSLFAPSAGNGVLLMLFGASKHGEMISGDVEAFSRRSGDGDERSGGSGGGATCISRADRDRHIRSAMLLSCSKGNTVAEPVFAMNIAQFRASPSKIWRSCSCHYCKTAFFFYYFFIFV